MHIFCSQGSNQKQKTLKLSFILIFVNSATKYIAFPTHLVARKRKHKTKQKEYLKAFLKEAAELMPAFFFSIKCLKKKIISENLGFFILSHISIVAVEKSSFVFEFTPMNKTIQNSLFCIHLKTRFSELFLSRIFTA